MIYVRSYLASTWRDLRVLPFKLIHDIEVLAILVLILIPWFLLLLLTKNMGSLQPLVWISGLVMFYWLIGYQHEIVLDEFRKPRLELMIALGFILLWMLYRVGEFWHWYTFFILRVGSYCGNLEDIAVSKMLEMFIAPFILLMALKYSASQMGFNWDKISWLAGGVPLIALIVVGLINHPWKSFAASSACYFFAAGLPEEFLFRAFLQTRLEAILRRQLLAAWLAAFIFGISHIPIDLAGSFSH